MRFFRRSLIALGVAAILPSLLFAAIVVFNLLRAEGRRVEADTLALSKDVGALIDARLNEEIAALQVLSTSSFLDSRQWQDYYPRLKHVWEANPDWSTVILYDALAREVIIDLRAPLSDPKPAPLPGETDLHSLASSSAVSIGGISMDDPADGHVIYLHMPVHRRQQLAYVFTIAMRPRVFQDILLARAPGTGVAAVVDREGRFIARTLDYEARIGQPATQFVRDAIRNGAEGIYPGTTYEGLQNYTAFHTSRLSGWSTHIAVPSGLIDRPLSWAFIVAAIAGLGCVLLGAVLVVLVLRDMSERRRAEETLRQSQKMEAVGQLTGGIAHDFNNLLTAIIGNLDLIRNRVGDNQRVRQLAENALEAARRGAKLTGQLLAFSRNQRMSLAPVQLSRLLDGMSDLLAQSVGPTIVLKVEIDPAADVVLSDSNQLELALLNLAVNARDAMPDGGSLTIGSHPARADDVRELPPGDYVEVRVADDGAGMSESVRARALEPFFTTKGVGQGTGLGLSQVYGVVRESGGAVLIESEPGRGTAVRLFLPAATLPPRNAAVEAAAAPVPHQQSESQYCILVVDDDRQVRRFIIESLRALHYGVLEAASAEEALTELHRASVDLVVADFAMPGMNGAELARVVRERWPGLPVLMVSGYADSAAVEAVVGSARFLRKPFDLAELRAAIAAALQDAAHTDGSAK